MTLLKLYREYAAKPDRRVSVKDLESKGYAPEYGYVLLHRLKESGLAVPEGPGVVRLLLPSEAKGETSMEAERWNRLVVSFKAKSTGHSALPKRYGVKRPKEYVLPPSRLWKFKSKLNGVFPQLRVSVERYEPTADVCLYSGRVRGTNATVEEALLHLYRRAPRQEFALALQATLMENSSLHWRRLQTSPEWPELAGVFNAVREVAPNAHLPNFRKARPPNLSLDEVQTIAQAYLARGT